jgi:hypothetical protein
LGIENPGQLQILAIVNLFFTYRHDYQLSPPGMATFSG